MSTKLEKTIRSFIKDNELDVDKQYLPEEENKRMNEIVYDGTQEERDEIFDSYDYDFDVSTSKYSFYKKVQIELNDNELNKYLYFKIIMNLDETNHKLNIIKGILIFWTVVLLAGYALVIFAGMSR